MFIPNESHYREIILPEHWYEFVARLPKLEPPLSIGQQSGISMKAHFVAQQIWDENPEDYVDNDED